MIRREDVPVERENMRGGSGTVIINNWLEDREKCPNLRMCSTITIPVGGSIGDHIHEGEAEVFRILYGKALYNDNGTQVQVGPGDVMINYDGQTHGVKNIGEEELGLLALIVQS